MSIVVFAAVALWQQSVEEVRVGRPTLIATVTHEPIDEMSGIVKSRTYSDTYWVHNDSGDEPRIFAIGRSGEVKAPGATRSDPPYPGIVIDLAVNVDWEDIAIDGATLYIGDLGNNGNARRDLGIYVVEEPNPLAIRRTRPTTWLPVAYPDQNAFPPANLRFDCEALFVSEGKLYLISKDRIGPLPGLPAATASLYRLDSGHVDKVNVLTLVESKSDLGGWVTGADLSPDGRRLAVLCQAPVQSVWVFEKPMDSDKFLSGRATRYVLEGIRQAEAICWDDPETLIITNEQRDVFELKVRR